MKMDFPGGTSGKEPICQCRRRKRCEFNPWVGKSPWRLGRAPGGGHGNPLQYSCLDNPMDSGAWWATVHRVAESRTQLKWLSTLHGDISSCFSSISSSYQSSTKNKLDAQEQRLNCSRKFKYELSVKQYFLGICTKVNKNLTQNI